MPALATTVVPAQVDVVIVGGGPAGLSAALVLGRSRRNVVVFDSGEYRNEGSTALHGWLTRDGASPEDVRRLGRAELARYGVHVVFGRVDSAQVDGAHLEVRSRAVPHPVRARALVLATGLRDVFPPIPGLQQLVGRGVCVCPYCDAYELRDLQLGVLGESGAGLALSLRTWSKDVILFTGGHPPAAAILADLHAVGVRIIDTPVARIIGTSWIEAVELRDGTRIPVAGVFVKLARQEHRSDLARQLGLAEVAGDITVDRRGATSMPGVWVAGDASRDLLFASIAVAEGAATAVAVNHALQLEGWGLR